MRPTPLLRAAVIVLMALPAFAQTPPVAPPTRIRGTVEKFDGHNLTVKSREGASLSVVLASDFAVRAVVAKTLADIKPGDKVGITSIGSSDGGRQAIEVHIFPASLRNVRLRETPWDLGRGSLMTNATVAQVISAPQGRMIEVTLNGKETKITVPPETPIVTYGPGDASLLKPGAAVFVIASKKPDGSLTAAGVTAEKDGVKPPM